MEEEVSIKVNIADRIYPLKVKISEEQRIRNAAKLINEKIRNYRQEFDIEDKTVLLSMCILQFVNELLELKENEDVDKISASEEISFLNRLLNEYVD